MPSVLIVDDNIDICRALRRLLAATGVSADCVHAGADALAYLGDGNEADDDDDDDDDAAAAADNNNNRDVPSVILLDLTMPDMDGVETLVRMRAAGFSGAVVMFTALSDDRNRRRAILAGADDYWVKGSIEPRQIIEMLRRYLRPRAPDVGGAD